MTQKVRVEERKDWNSQPSPLCALLGILCVWDTCLCWIIKWQIRAVKSIQMAGSEVSFWYFFSGYSNKCAWIFYCLKMLLIHYFNFHEPSTHPLPQVAVVCEINNKRTTDIIRTTTTTCTCIHRVTQTHKRAEPNRRNAAAAAAPHRFSKYR